MAPRYLQTEQDIAEIAGAGLNWIRLPLPFWAIETIEGEPYLEGVAWNYFLKSVSHRLRVHGTDRSGLQSY